MIKSSIGHLVYCIDLRNIGFYKDLFTFLGWSIWYDEPYMLGVGSEQGTSLWFGRVTHAVANNYDGPGLNHLAIAVETQAEVDQVVVYLQEHALAALFETPRHRPEFSGGAGKTYYQVMFESPDRLLFEVVYTGPIS